MTSNNNSDKKVPSEVFITQAKELVEKANSRGIPLRIMGALAIRIHSKGFEELHRRLKRLGGGTGIHRYRSYELR